MCTSHHSVEIIDLPQHLSVKPRSKALRTRETATGPVGVERRVARSAHIRHAAVLHGGYTHTNPSYLQNM